MDELPTVRELMTRDYLALRPSLGLLEAIDQLEQHPEDTAFVLNERDQFLGVVTEKACLRTLSARAYDNAIAETVEDVMCPPPDVLRPTTDAYTAAQAFLSCACGLLPVVDDGGTVLGAVSQIGLLRTFVAVLRQRGTTQADVERAAGDLKNRPETKEGMQRVAANLDPEQLATLFRRSVRHKE